MCAWCRVPAPLLEMCALVYYTLFSYCMTLHDVRVQCAISCEWDIYSALWVLYNSVTPEIVCATPYL